MRYLVAFTLLGACAHIDTPVVIDKPLPAAPAPIATVDIAAVGIGLTVEGASGETATVRSQAEATLVNSTIDALGKRAYTVTGVLKKAQKSTADATLYIRGSSFVPHAQPGTDTSLRGGNSNYLAWRTTQDQCETEKTNAITDSSKTDLEQYTPSAQCSMLSPFPPDEDPSPPAESLNDNATVGDAQDPSLFVTMSLWDNRTGEMLWRAHVDAAANAAHQDEVAQVARALIKSLPARR